MGVRKNLPIINLVLILAVLVSLWVLRDDKVPPPVAKRIVEPVPVPQSVQKSPVQPKQESLAQPKPKIAKAPPSPPKPSQPKKTPTPAPQKQAAPKAPTPTAPEISLHGVVLVNGTRIAILNGTHSAAMENRSPKRKSYKIGDAVGNYRVREIDRNSVTLADSQGKPLKIKMTKQSSTDH